MYQEHKLKVYNYGRSFLIKMRYIAEYNLGKWLLVNTADASAKWYSTNYILQLSKTHKINGVVNGSVMLADKDKLSIYLRNMLKPTLIGFIILIMFLR